jgi:hypothetical protein
MKEVYSTLFEPAWKEADENNLMNAENVVQ